jgi:hypothetical protein
MLVGQEKGRQVQHKLCLCYTNFVLPNVVHYPLGFVSLVRVILSFFTVFFSPADFR